MVWKPSEKAIQAALEIDTGIGQGASYDHSRYIYINAVLEAAYAVDFGNFIKSIEKENSKNFRACLEI